MFDAVLTGGNAPQRRLGSGLVFTVAAYVVFGLAVYLVPRHRADTKVDREVKFIAPQGMPPPPPPPPPPPAGGATKPKTEQQKKPTPVKKTDTLVETKDKKEDEPEKPKEPEKKDDTAGQAGGVEGGVDGGVAGGTVGGVVGGVIGGVLGGTLGGTLGSQTPTNTTLSFGEGMTPPVMQSGGQPVYPREALEAKVEGKVIAKCTITEDGHLVDCRIIKGLPFMDGPVLSSLASRKYSPVMFQGRAVRVYYTFPFTFKMP